MALPQYAIAYEPNVTWASIFTATNRIGTLNVELTAVCRFETDNAPFNRFITEHDVQLVQFLRGEVHVPQT